MIIRPAAAEFFHAENGWTGKQIWRS